MRSCRSLSLRMDTCIGSRLVLSAASGKWGQRQAGGQEQGQKHARNYAVGVAATSSLQVGMKRRICRPQIGLSNPPPFLMDQHMTQLIVAVRECQQTGRAG
jgi:hypothetical protein